MLSFPDLPARILYGWAELYRQQLQRGQDYDQLRPTYAIWLLAEALLPDDADYAHRYRLRDDQGRALIDHGGIWLLELSKFTVAQVVTEQQRWLKFFTDGEHLDAAALPPWMQTDEMRQAMTTLIAFSDKERAYHLYQARQNFLRQQRSMKRHLLEARAAKEEALQAREAAVLARDAERKEKETALREKEAALQAKETALQAKEAERQAKEAALQEKTAALAEIERLKALLQGTPAP